MDRAKGSQRQAVGLSRREAIALLSGAGLSALLPRGQARARDGGGAGAHPRIYLRARPGDGLRTVDDLRRAIESDGRARGYWQVVRARCEARLGEAPLTPRSAWPGRGPGAAERNNPDYRICRAAGEGMLGAALAFLVTDDRRFRAAALAQLDALLDASQWPDWIDQAHLNFGLPADLRTGMLSFYAGLTFDWLYSSLDDTERERIVAGIVRRGIEPFLESVEQDPWWSRDLNNWLTVIYGGVGVAGMCLEGHHPAAEQVIAAALPQFARYRESYGREGEFNESVAYSNASFYPVAFYQAYRYATQGTANPLARRPFPQAGRWSIYATLPPGRYAAFGDGAVDAKPQVDYFAAIAAASRDGVLQGFVERHLEASDSALPLLWYDPTVEASSPEGRLALGAVFPEKGGLIFSRSSWDAESPEMVVYGKAKRDENHGHNDLGQLCIDARGERLIVDLGSPSSYPPDFFEAERWRYYNASVEGHNVLQIGGREQKSPPEARGAKSQVDLEAVNGRYTQTRFDDERGAAWQIDLTPAYAGARLVRRSVLHLLPGWVAALEEAVLEREEDCVLRWHTIRLASPDGDGRFLVKGESVGLAALVATLEGSLLGQLAKRHGYRAPYDRDRAGQLLEERAEPFVETRVRGKRIRLLSLFCLSEIGGGPESASVWQQASTGRWRAESPMGSAVIEVNDERIRGWRAESPEAILELPLGG